MMNNATATTRATGRTGLPEPALRTQGKTMRGVGPAVEPALLASGAMDGEAQTASSERSPGWAQRTSGETAGATPTHHT